MNPVLRNTLAVIGGLVVGGAVNMGLVLLGGRLVAPPEGVDVTNMEAIAASVHLFEPKHFLFPFLAHAFGTLAGALVATRLAASRHMTMGMIIGIVFLAGGTANAFMIPAPAWFNALDLILAYLPMGWVGARLARPQSDLS